MTMGRPTKINETLKRWMLYLYEQGSTDQQVADTINVDVSTIHNWKIKYPEFFNAIKTAKTYSDDEVEKTLFRIATGTYEHPETKYMSVSHGMNQGSEIEKIETTKRYPPDVRAIKYWLNNRQPDKWREKIDHSHSNPDGSTMIPTVINIVGVTKEDLEKEND